MLFRPGEARWSFAKPHRQECLCNLPPTASAWRFYADHGARWGAECAFGWKAASASFDDYFIFAGPAWRSTLQSVGALGPAVRQNRGLHFGEHFDFADDAVAAGKFST